MNHTPGGWVPLRKILDLGIAQYGRVIKDLREGKANALSHRKYDIQSHDEWIGGKHYSWFRFIEPNRHPYQMKFMGMR